MVETAVDVADVPEVQVIPAVVHKPAAVVERLFAVVELAAVGFDAAVVQAVAAAAIATPAS